MGRTACGGYEWRHNAVERAAVSSPGSERVTSSVLRGDSILCLSGEWSPCRRRFSLECQAGGVPGKDWRVGQRPLGGGLAGQALAGRNLAGAQRPDAGEKDLPQPVGEDEGRRQDQAQDEKPQAGPSGVW